MGGLGCETPESGPFGSKKWTFWTPPTLLQKTSFLAHFVAKSGPFGRFGRCIILPAPLAMGLMPIIEWTWYHHLSLYLTSLPSYFPFQPLWILKVQPAHMPSKWLLVSCYLRSQLSYVRPTNTYPNRANWTALDSVVEVAAIQSFLSCPDHRRPLWRRCRGRRVLDLVPPPAHHLPGIAFHMWIVLQVRIGWCFSFKALHMHRLTLWCAIFTEWCSSWSFSVSKLWNENASWNKMHFGMF